MSLNTMPQSELVKLEDGQAVTTSLAVAKGTENVHESIMRLVKNYQADLEEFGKVGFEIRPFEVARGRQQQTVALLNEQQATLLLTYMRNNDIVRAFKKRLVKAFWELAAQATHPVHFLAPKTLPEALRLAADLAEQLEHKKKEVTALVPKATFYDKVCDTVNGQTIQEVAKILDTGPNRLFIWLREQGLLMRNNLPYQIHLDNGHFRVVERQYNDQRGESRTYTRTLITGKGLAFVQKRFGENVA